MFILLINAVACRSLVSRLYNPWAPVLRRHVAPLQKRLCHRITNDGISAEGGPLGSERRLIVGFVSIKAVPLLTGMPTSIATRTFRESESLGLLQQQLYVSNTCMQQILKE